MREDGHEVGQRGELHVAANEGVECRAGTDVHTAHQRAGHAAEHRRVERVVEPRANSGEEGAKGCGVVPRQGPEQAARDNVTADRGQQRRDERHD